MSESTFSVLIRPLKLSSELSKVCYRIVECRVIYQHPTTITFTYVIYKSCVLKNPVKSCQLFQASNPVTAKMIQIRSEFCICSHTGVNCKIHLKIVTFSKVYKNDYFMTSNNLIYIEKTLVQTTIYKICCILDEVSTPSSSQKHLFPDKRIRLEQNLHKI